MKTNSTDSVITLVDSPFPQPIKDYKHFQNDASDLQNSVVGSGSGHSRFLQVCFDIGFFFIIVPFRFKSDGTVSTNKIQRIICGIGYLFTIYRYLTEVRKFPFVALKRMKMNYFIFFQKVASTIFHTVLIKILWFDVEKFARINAYLHRMENLRSRKSLITLKAFPLTICTTYILIGLGTFVFGTRIVDGLSYENLAWFYQRNVAEARYAFFISSSVNTSTAPEMKDIVAGDHVAVAVLLFGNYFRCVAGFYFDSIIFMACLALWLPANAFADQIKSQIQVIREQKRNRKNLDHNEIVGILSKYMKLKHFTHLINDTLQFAVLTYMIETVVYYSIYIDAIFLAPDWFRQLRVGMAMCGVVTMMSFASDICTKVGKMKDWLAEDEIHKIIPELKITILLDQLSTNPVSISGGVFTITYCLLGMIGTTLVTYFIMCSTVEVRE